MERIEATILRNLVFNEDYSRKVIPFIQPDYFEQKTEKIIFEEIVKFIVKYGSAITIEALNIEVENRTDLTEDQIKEIRDINGSLNDNLVDKQWLIDTTEKWCRDKAIYIAFDFYHKKKTRFHLIWNTLTRLRKVVFLIRLLTSLLLGQVLVSLFSCVIWLAPVCLTDVMCFTLQWRWQRRKLLNVLTQTF
jgi:hypothetical protein